MRDIFKPEDFDIDQRDASLIDIAHQANAKLNKLIESWPVVYGPAISEYYDWNGSKNRVNRFQARLAFIEEIKKEPCQHRPYVRHTHYLDNGAPMPTMCELCGVELVQTWSEKK